MGGLFSFGFSLNSRVDQSRLRRHFLASIAREKLFAFLLVAIENRCVGVLKARLVSSVSRRAGSHRDRLAHQGKLRRAAVFETAPNSGAAKAEARQAATIAIGFGP